MNKKSTHPRTVSRSECFATQFHCSKNAKKCQQSRSEIGLLCSILRVRPKIGLKSYSKAAYNVLFRRYTIEI